MKEMLIFLSTVLSPTEIKVVEQFGFNMLEDGRKAHYAQLAWSIKKDEIKLVKLKQRESASCK